MFEWTQHCAHFSFQHVSQHTTQSVISLLSLHERLIGGGCGGFGCGVFFLDIINAQLEAESTDFVPTETAATAAERMSKRCVLINAVLPFSFVTPKVGCLDPASVTVDARGCRGIDLGRAERSLQALCIFGPFDARGDLNDSVLRLEHLSQRDKLVFSGIGVARGDHLIFTKLLSKKSIGASTILSKVMLGSSGLEQTSFEMKLGTVDQSSYFLSSPA